MKAIPLVPTLLVLATSLRSEARGCRASPRPMSSSAPAVYGDPHQNRYEQQAQPSASSDSVVYIGRASNGESATTSTARPLSGLSDASISSAIHPSFVDSGDSTMASSVTATVPNAASSATIFGLAATSSGASTSVSSVAPSTTTAAQVGNAQQGGTFGISVTAGQRVSEYTRTTVTANGEVFDTYTRIYDDTTYDAGVFPDANADTETTWKTAFSAYGDGENPSCEVPTTSVENGVALSMVIMSRTFIGSHSLFCGQTLTLHAAGNNTPITATVVDSCGACSPNPYGRVDMTSHAASAMGMVGSDGVIYGSWSFNEDKYRKLWQTLAPRAEQIPVPGSPSTGAITDRNGDWVPPDWTS